jgi:dephospho-CoA kinase
MVIGIIGQRLSGKDTVGDYLVEKYGAFHIKYSMVLDEILDMLDQPKSRRNEIDLGMALRQVFHEGVLNAAIKKKVLNANQGIKVINGIRFQDEYNNAQALGAEFIYVTAPQEILYERFLKRKQKADDNALSVQEFTALENEPTEIKISQLGEKCGYKIVNTGSLEDLYKKVDDILIKLKQ